MKKLRQYQNTKSNVSQLLYALAGGVIALILISIFLAGVNNPKPEWPRFWMIKPFIIVSLAGAAGGFCFFYVSCFFGNTPGKRILGYLIGILVFTIGLWLGAVLGLNGTLWN